MSRAGRKTKRKRLAVSLVQSSASVIDVLRRRLANPDTRSHAVFLADMRAEQAAGRLANPATAALLDRLEGAVR